MSERNKNLGKKATDTITGYEGTITGFAQYITGCDQYLVTPRCKADSVDKYPDGNWFDENRLKIDEEHQQMKIETDKAKGAMDTPPVK